MRYRELGNSGIQISSISLGTWGIGGTGWGDINREESIAAIRTAVEQGVTTIDTAPIYGFGNPAIDDFGYGNAEVLLKDALQGIDRSKLVITTKCGLNYDRALGPRSMYKRMTKQEVIEGCEGSLRRLGTDYIDVLFIHWPDNQTPIEEPLEAMRQLMDQGKIRVYGLSNFTVEDTLKADSLLHVGAIQPQFSMVQRDFEPLMRAAKEHNIGTMTYGSLGSGILTGAIRELPNFAPNDTRVTFYDYFREPKFSKIMELLKVLDDVAAAHGATPAEVAINWSTQKSFVDTAILGMDKPKFAMMNCAAMAWQLSDEEIARLDAAIDEHLK